MQGNIKNRNGRVYPTKVLNNEVDRYNKEYIQKNRAYGELGHPTGPTINLERVSHMITKLERDGDNYVGRAKIMTETPYGAIVKSLMDEGATLGVSSRGMGSLKQSKSGVAEVQKDFYLATAADIVADPSAPNAFVEGIMEGADWVFNASRNEWATVATDSIRSEMKAMTAANLEKKKLALFERFINSVIIP